MKFLKFLLVLVIIAVIFALGGVIFSNRIIAHLTKTDSSRFENLKYSIKDGEIVFDNFILNGEKLGKGKAKIKIVRGGKFGISPEVKLESMELQEVKSELLYNAADPQIDSFIEKINVPAEHEKIVKTTKSYIKETTARINNLDKNIDDFFNMKKGNIEAVNKLKQDYGLSTDLKEKSSKLIELNKELKNFNEQINTEKEKVNKEISEIEAERSIMIENISGDLDKLEKIISLNDVENLNSYIFLERGREIGISLNKTLKAVKFIKKIRDNSELSISSISVNNGEIVFSGLEKGKKTSKGQVTLGDNIKADVTETDKGYEISYNKDDIALKTLFGEGIISTVEYSKKDLLEGKALNLISELIFENNNFKNLNKTVLSEKDKKMLEEKINGMKSERYNEIMKEYEDQTKSLEGLIDDIYAKEGKLDKLQRGLLSLNTILNISDYISGDTAGTSTVNTNTEVKSEENNGNENKNSASGDSTAKDVKDQLKKIFN